MSFTTGSLFHQESLKLAELFLDLKERHLVRSEVISKNLLQTRTLNTSRRICSEIISRLKTLNRKELELLVHSDKKEQGYLLWIAACRRYPFIGDFAREVVRERYIGLQTHLHQTDFDAFFNKTSEWHPELDDISPATKKKLRQVLFKMMREADLLSTQNMIKAALFTPRILKALSRENRQDLMYFPFLESELNWNQNEA